MLAPRLVQSLERPEDQGVDDGPWIHLVGAALEGLAECFHPGLLIGIARHNPPIDYLAENFRGGLFVLERYAKLLHCGAVDLAHAGLGHAKQAADFLE